MARRRWRFARSHAPDVVLLDLSMPGPTPLVTIADLSRAHRNMFACSS